MGKRPRKGPKQVETLTHGEARRKNIPTAELQSAAQRAEEINPFKPVTYLREYPLPKGETRPRDEDLDPQIVWKGATLRLSPDQIAQLTETGGVEIGDAQLVWGSKDQQDWSDLVVQAPPLYIQEKIHPKAIIEDLKRQTKDRREADAETPDFFADFNGVDPEAKTEFYQHDQNWQNRMILGDSLQVMASLAEREGLHGQVQCIYFDPPYGIKFNSNWQVSTRSRDVSDGKLDQITREPEQVKAFRDTWKDGIHSYLTYLRDRFTAMRDLLTESGSIFVQIGDENVHRVRAVMDEVFGENNFICAISAQKTGSQSGNFLQATSDDLLWYARNKGSNTKYRPLFLKRDGTSSRLSTIERDDFGAYPLTSDGIRSTSTCDFEFEGRIFHPGKLAHWKVVPSDLARVGRAGRIVAQKSQIRLKYFHEDYPVTRLGDYWNDVGGATGKVYVVQTSPKLVERCIMMTTDPGDLVLDPTCGSGTTAYVAEQWGRRWITTDTSRVALALARARVMGANYPYYYLADSESGVLKEAEVTGKIASDHPVQNDVRNGFVYNRIPRVTLGAIASNTEIDVIWGSYQEMLEPLRHRLNAGVGKSWEEWEIPRDAGDDWSEAARKAHAEWWELRIARQQEIDKSIAHKADVELLYDRPYEDTSKIRVSGPFTVESLSPHRVVPAGEVELIEQLAATKGKRGREDVPFNDFTQMVLENLKSAGVHQAAKDDRITFSALEGWPGNYIAAEGHFMEGETERRAAIFIGPEFGTVTRADLTAVAREALDARFDALIACGFNFDAHTSELTKLGPLPILKAKMNPDLHMSEELKNTGAGNLFIVFGEPDVEWKFNDEGKIIVEVLGVDVFDPKTGEVRASGKDDIAAWFIDTDYNEESFFVRRAYFMGANDPYKSLKASLKAEIDREAWETLYRDVSQPFPRPSTGRFAVKVINHFGDEVMKVFGV